MEGSNTSFCSSKFLGTRKNFFEIYRKSGRQTGSPVLP